jgi:hypothetical protein
MLVGLSVHQVYLATGFTDDTPILPIAAVTHAALKIRVKHSHPSANETCPYPSAMKQNRFLIV